MVRKQEKSDLTGLIKWKFQKVTFFLLTLYNCNKGQEISENVNLFGSEKFEKSNRREPFQV